MQITNLKINSVSYTSASPVKRGESVLVSVTIKREYGDSCNGIVVTGGNGSQYVLYSSTSWTVSEGASKTLSFVWTVPENNVWLNNMLSSNPLFSDPKWRIYMGSFGAASEIEYPIQYMRYNPTINSFGMVRSTDGIEDDEGEEVLTTLLVSLTDGYDISETSMLLYYRETYDVSTSQYDGYISLTSSVSSALQGITDSSTLISKSFSNGSDWNFLLCFTGYGETTEAKFTLDRSFANLHLAGLKNGGISFGGFGSSTEDKPKFESYYPSYLYGGIATLGEGMATFSHNSMGIQYGIISPGTMNTGIVGTTTLTFNHTFMEPPIVFLQPVCTTGARVTATVINGSVTNSQATIKVANDTTSSQNIQVYWLAIGQPSVDPDAVITLRVPSIAMTKATSSGCQAKSSSNYSSSVPAWKAFDYNTSTYWASSTSESSPWIALKMNTSLKNIVVSVYARTSSTIKNPTSGNIQGSNNGTSWTTLKSFSGWDPSGNASGVLLGTISCGNSTAYQYIKMNITANSGSTNSVAIGYIQIDGEK